MLCATLRVKVLTAPGGDVLGPTVDQMQRILPGAPRVRFKRLDVLLSSTHAIFASPRRVVSVVPRAAFQLLFKGATPVFPIDVREFGDAELPREEVKVRTWTTR